MFCKTCGYCLQGLRDLRCPECARKFESGDSQTYRVESATRGCPIWLVASLSIVLAVLACAAFALEIRVILIYEEADMEPPWLASLFLRHPMGCLAFAWAAGQGAIAGLYYGRARVWRLALIVIVFGAVVLLASCIVAMIQSLAPAVGPISI